jgi:outer membrane protein assembly factor BamD
MAMRKLFILLFALLLLVSCAPKTAKKPGNPGDLYVEGVNLMKQKKYGKAIERFSEIRDNYPFDALAMLATVKLGDVYFEKEEYILASGVYEEFLKAHPEDENIPYVLLQAGQCYERLSLSIDRDQGYTNKAIERFTYLQNRYGNSTYAANVGDRIKKMTEKLSDREIYVASFYYRTYQYNAAITRFDYFLAKYPGAKGTDSALFHLSLCHRELGNLSRSDYYADLLRKEYPKSVYARARIRERKSLQLAKASLTDGQAPTKRDIDLSPRMTLAERPKERDDLAFFDESKPVDIVADSVEGFEKDRRVLFKGSVVARQEDLYIFADTMEAFTNEQSNEIDRVVARGNVRIVKKDRTATANEGTFDNKSRIVSLKGNVIVFSGTDRVTGELVTYYVDKERVVVEGEKEKKARITITPR